MLRLLSSLEPRYYEPQEYIIEQGEDVDEQVFVISRDARKYSSSQYCIGFKYDRRSKYFHVKLGPKSIICVYENLFGHKAEFTYKALTPVDAYGLRKAKL